MLLSFQILLLLIYYKYSTVQNNFKFGDFIEGYILGYTLLDIIITLYAFVHVWMRAEALNLIMLRSK